MRVWKIDFARGVAVALMVLFNWSYALRYLGVTGSDGNWIYWWLLPRIIASMFIFIAGVALSISYSKNNKWEKHVLRGGRLLAIGLAITAVTYIAFPRDFIVFGILHFIGVSIIISLPLLRVKENVVLISIAAAAFLAGLFLQPQTFGFSYLLWLGFIPEGFSTLDYFPLLPWFGVFVLGLYSGRTLHNVKKHSTEIKYAKPLTLLGRHSLAIYIIHQPLLIAILYVLGFL